MAPIADPIFADARLARIYDDLDGPRPDLDAYLAIVDELGARSVFDIGCGTGSLAVLLAARGLDVTGVDPAAASLAVARAKPGADAVRWVHGIASDALPLQVDLVVMTGNVAQVFVNDNDWHATLLAAHTALRPGGHLVFETRDPDAEGWRAWTPEASRRVVPSYDDSVECWVELTGSDARTVSFRWTFVFASNGAVLTSDSTLRFRTKEELTSSLNNAGFSMLEIRDAPDRPGKEFVVLSRRS